DLEAGFDLRGPHGARGRTVRDVLPVYAFQHVVLYAVVDQRVHLHQPVERRARGFQQQLQVAEDDVRLARQRAGPALAAVRVDRDDARAENEPAGADGGRLEVPVMPPQIESGQRCGDHFAHRMKFLVPGDSEEVTTDEVTYFTSNSAITSSLAIAAALRYQRCAVTSSP